MVFKITIRYQILLNITIFRKVKLFKYIFDCLAKPYNGPESSKFFQITTNLRLMLTE